MAIRNIKNTVILAIITVASISSCQQDYYFSLNPRDDQTGQFTKETYYCENEPEIEIGSVENTYDSDGNLILTKKKLFGSYYSMTEKLYDYSGLKTIDNVYSFSNGSWELNYTYEYFYSLDILQKKITKNQDGIETNKTVYSYRGRKLDWEDFYRFSEGEWKFRYAHKFDFNGNGQLARKSSYQTVEKDKVYDYFTYSYKKGKLSEEERILITGKVGYHKDYFYNQDGTLDYIIQDGNMVEENFYENGRLIEKHTWYYGIDPGFYFCGGNIIYRYEY